MTIYGRDKIKKIAKKLSLPEWWIKSVIVEYFPCRRYGKKGKLCIFDFNKLSEQDMEQIAEKKVVIPNYKLVQNIRPIDLTNRISLSYVGLPFTTLEHSELIPEGLTNNSVFPFPLRHNKKMQDPKTTFFQYAIVREDNYFYQWKVAEMLKLDEKNYYWYKSDIVDLNQLFQVNEKMRELNNSNEKKNPNAKFIVRIENIYQEIEKARVPIREKILKYHYKMKPNYDTSKAHAPKVPMLSYFDGIRLTENGYQIKTHMEPLFLRTAIRNLTKAQEANTKRNSNSDDHFALLDEIEHSAMCIIAATNCLESYINYVFNKHLPDEPVIFDDTTNHRQKWLFVPTALDLPFRFKPDEKPFSDFSQLVKWRNNTIHHRAEFTRARGTVSHTYNQLNVENAKLSIKIVRDMVVKLSEGGKIPLPVWIKTDMGSSPGYWDEVLNYLKSIKESA